MIPKSKNSIVTVVIHLLVWGVFSMLLFFFQPLSWNITIPYQLWIKQTLLILMLVIAFYLNSFLLVPKLLLKNKTAPYLLYIIVAAVVIVVLNGYIDKSLNLHHLMDEAFHKKGPPKHRGEDHTWDISQIAALTGTIALVVGISTSITAIQKWQKDKLVHQELEQDRVTSELSFLKAQINPHFFFNTLNNIYALTHVNVETSRKAIHQLSRMMRYVLYDTENSITQLSQEIAFIKDYISLMQLRLTDVVKIDLDVPTLLKDVPIAPMLFLPFVENAFKHGVSATQPTTIAIAIEQKGDVLDLNIVNTIIKEQNNNLEAGSGIGLNNTRRRLDLLYAGKYTLLINENTSNNTYSVHLKIDLS